MLSFENTQIAFESRSNAELRRAYWLYRLLGINWLVSAAPTLLKLALWLRLPVLPIIRSTIFKQFCGGESIENSKSTIDNLARYNIGTILDYSAEGKSSEEAFEKTTQELVHIIEYAAANAHIPFAVFKITGLARFELLEKLNKSLPLSSIEKAEFNRVKSRVQLICEKAHHHNVPVFIDAEESWIQDAIDNLATEMMLQFNQSKPIVYNTIQLYRSDRFEFLQQSFQKAEAQNYHLGVKLVRGAYMEKERERAAQLQFPDPIHDSKEETDAAFNEAVKFSLENIHRISICFGSHNEDSTIYLTQLMSKHELSKNDPRIYFSQLLGMSDHISFNLANEGYNVAKYVPYGPVREVMPYLIRRAEENRSIAGQTSRELLLLQSETLRRRSH